MAARDMVNLLRGSVEIEVTGEFPERFLNLCAQRGVAFWNMSRPDSHTLRLTVAWTDGQGLDQLAARTGCTVKEGERRGVPPFLLRFRKRYAFLVGLALAILAVSFLSRFVLVVEVEGNVQVPAQAILTALQREGLKPGAYGPSLALRDISNSLLLQMEDLSWATVNLRGIRAQVVVRERVEAPQIVDETIIGDIVANVPGLVTRMEVWSGDPAVSKGSTVLPGDVLIRGSVEMKPPQYSELSPLWMPVRAMGEVEGRTWRIMAATIPLTAQVKSYTGKTTTRWYWTSLGRRGNFFQNSGISYPIYDKISETWPLTLPGGMVLPFSLGRETYRAYELIEAPVDQEAAQTLLEEQLLRRLYDLLGETGEEVSHSFSAQVEGGWLTVTLTAECTELLGRFVPAVQTPAPEG